MNRLGVISNLELKGFRLTLNSPKHFCCEKQVDGINVSVFTADTDAPALCVGLEQEEDSLLTLYYGPDFKRAMVLALAIAAALEEAAAAL